MKLPTELMIMGKKVNIEYVDGLENEGEAASGLCHSGLKKIQICTKENETEEDILNTLGHEMIHFVLHTTGWSAKLGDDEESLVVALEENFLPLFNHDRKKWKKREEVELGS